MKSRALYYKAVRERDARFDGIFFIGVKTTGIYCRPICPAKPNRENIEFYPTAAAAERAGYRACLRCRPETVPFSPAWLGKTAVVKRAMKMLLHANPLHFKENDFADIFGMTARHLRRLFVSEIGLTPKQIFFENRLTLAAKLLTETNTSISEIAYAAGFKSIRRFNDAFKDRFRKSPTDIRQNEKDSHMPKRQWEMKSPIGPLHLVVSDKGLHGIFWKKQNVPVMKSLEDSTLEVKILNKTIRQLEEYFSGQRKTFDVPLTAEGTEFQKRVWYELSQIPYGKTYSYRDIAKKIKKEKAFRAVGTANGRNPLSIIVPCHRVIAADGSLGGYAGGLANKTKLLELEQKHCK